MEKSENRLTDCEIALENFRNELRKAILNEELPMKIEPDDTMGSYYAELEINIGGTSVCMSIADEYLCYHYHRSNFLKGLFDNEEDFDALSAVVHKYVNPLSSADKEKIAALEQQIEEIKKGKSIEIGGVK